MEQLLRLFLSHLVAIRKSPHTIRNYTYDMKQFASYVSTHVKSALTPDTLKQVCIDYWIELRNQEPDKAYHERTLNRKKSTVRRFIRYLFETKVIKEDFSDFIELFYPISNDHMDILRPEEIDRICSILDTRIRYGKTEELRFMHRRNKVAFHTLLYTGMKTSELVMLKWIHIRFDTSEIVIPQRKSLEPRVIPLPERLSAVLLRYKEVLTTLSTFDPSYLDGYLFFGIGRTAHSKLNVKTIERMMDSLAKEASMNHKEITPHSLRNTMASYAIQQNTPISTLSVLLGHSRPSVTSHAYSPLLHQPAKRRKETYP